MNKKGKGEGKKTTLKNGLKTHLWGLKTPSRRVYGSRGKNLMSYNREMIIMYNINPWIRIQEYCIKSARDEVAGVLLTRREREFRERIMG